MDINQLHKHMTGRAYHATIFFNQNKDERTALTRHPTLPVWLRKWISGRDRLAILSAVTNPYTTWQSRDPIDELSLLPDKLRPDLRCDATRGHLLLSSRQYPPPLQQHPLPKRETSGTALGSTPRDSFQQPQQFLLCCNRPTMGRGGGWLV